MLIRLVGGPLHNHFADTELTSHSSETGHLYYEVTYKTGWGTRYKQFVHESLVRGTKIHISTYRERFLPFCINQLELERRLKTPSQNVPPAQPHAAHTPPPTASGAGPAV